LGPPCVLARNDIDFAQDTEGALRNVFEIADWRSDDEKRSGHGFSALWHCDRGEQKPRRLPKERRGYVEREINGESQ